MHDKNGKPIKAGDKVRVEAVISETFATDEFCNVTLKIGADAPHGPRNVQSTVVLNAAQVELIEE